MLLPARPLPFNAYMSMNTLNQDSFNIIVDEKIIFVFLERISTTINTTLS